MWTRKFKAPFSRIVVVVGEALLAGDDDTGRENRDALARELSARLGLAREKACVEAAR